MWTVALTLCLLMIGCSCIYHVLVVIAALRFRSTPEPPNDFTPPVSVFKPLLGLERDLYELLAGFCRQDYPEYEILFAVAEDGDAAVDVVRQLQREFPSVSIRLLIADRRYGTNKKIDSLEKMFLEMRHDFLAISDADMRVKPDYLRRIMRPLQHGEVGLVTCLYRAEPGGTLPSVFEAIGTTGEFPGGVLVARMLEGVKFAFGSSMATRKELVEAFGGFPVLADYQGDDFEIGNRVASLGREVVISRLVVDTVLPADTWVSMLQHQFRWVSSTAGSRPKGHLGLIFTYGLPFILAALALAPRSLAVWIIAGVWLLLRLTSAWVVGVLVLRDPVLRKYLFLVPARDLISFALWAASFFNKHTTWKGTRFRLEKGKLRPD